MALSQQRSDKDIAEYSIPAQAPRAFPVDAATAEIEPHHYLEPEVNRLKEWAMRANAEIAEEATLNSQIQALPPGIAIGVMIGASVVLWGILLMGATLIF